MAANLLPGLTESESTPPWPKIHGFSINTTSCPASGEYTLQPASPNAINTIRYFIDLPFQNQIQVAEGTVKPSVLLTCSVCVRHDRGADRQIRRVGPSRPCSQYQRLYLRCRRLARPRGAGSSLGSATHPFNGTANAAQAEVPDAGQGLA